MKYRLFFAIGVFIVVGLAFAAWSSRTNKAVPDFKIKAIHAYLYYESSGTMSRDVLNGDSFALWNTFIGAGDAEAPSGTTMIVIEMSCPKEQLNVPAGRKLKVVISQGKKTLENKTLEFPFIHETGKIFMPILVYGYNDSPMKITATIIGQKKVSSLVKTLEFHAGE